MTYNQPNCPECGHPWDEKRPKSERSRCRKCGFKSGDSAESVGWLGLGDTLALTLEAGLLKLPGLAAQTSNIAPTTNILMLTLEMTDLWEDFEDRRVMLARVVDCSGSQERPLNDALRAAIGEMELVIEQETDELSIDGERLPAELAAQVRRPVARRAYQGTTITVFRNNGGLALDELIEVGVGRLNLAQIRALFASILDAVATIHSRGLVHLRLTPWTVRVRDPLSPQGIPLAFLRDVMNCGDQAREVISQVDAQDSSAVGAGQTAGSGNPSAFEVDYTGDTLDPSTPSPFLKTRENLLATKENPDPAVRADSSRPYEDTDEFKVPAAVSAASHLAAEQSWSAVELRLIFDGIEGFLPAHSGVDQLPFAPGFSAPELLSQPGPEGLEACDIFSLGMLLYFLVAGQPAPVSIYTRQTPAIPARNLRPDFPPGLQAVIGRATRPEPSERYPNIDALRQAFERACDVMQSRGRPAGSAPRALVAADTHTGLGKRRRNPVNQDAVFTDVTDDGQLALVVVADGVSTASFGSGDLASSALAGEARATWTELNEAYLQGQQIQPRRVIQGILNRVNERIVDYVNSRYSPFVGAPHEVMGTTALVALVLGGEVTLATLGDSRVYLARGEAFEQLTIDHNLWTLSILDGVEADSALGMPHGEALARCLGTFIIEDERLAPLEPEPDFMRFQFIRGDTLLFTTDGLIDFAAVHMLTAEDYVHNILASEPDPGLACLELILLANRGGGGDNIGVGIVKFI